MAKDAFSKFELKRTYSQFSQLNSQAMSFFHTNFTTLNKNHPKQQNESKEIAHKATFKLWGKEFARGIFCVYTHRMRNTPPVYSVMRIRNIVTHRSRVQQRLGFVLCVQFYLVEF